MSVNKEHLLKIKQHILEEPNRLDMSTWGAKGFKPGTEVEDDYSNSVQIVPRCGTIACIAGWSAFLRGEDFVNPEIELSFLKLQDSTLFYPTRWPRELQKRYELSDTPQEKAQVAAETIDLIIAGDGVFPRE